MSRRSLSIKKTLLPDILYKSLLVSILSKQILKKGKQNLALKQIAKTFLFIKEQTNKNPVKIFEEAIFNAKPLIELKTNPNNINQKIPIEINPYKGILLSVRSILNATKGNKQNTLSLRLSNEILCAANGIGKAINKINELKKIIKATKALIYYD
jgi:small subunit ribosomal protein S7